jgi:hypothetical protein
MTRLAIDQAKPKFDTEKVVSVDDALIDTEDRELFVLATGNARVTDLPPRQRDIATFDESGETATPGGIGDGSARRRRQPEVVES